MNKLPILYQQMADLTSPICANECTQDRDKATRCCEPKYCSLTEQFARDKYGIELEKTDHPVLQYMGSQGCTVAPWLRPICTLHACPINYGAKACLPNDPERSAQYWALRKEIISEAKDQKKLPENENGEFQF